MPELTAPRRQQAEERREQILEAAIRVFADKGYAGASMRDISRAVGVTEGLIYHYFASKDQLLQAAWKERSWRAQLERILAGAEGAPVASVLRSVVEDFLGTLREKAPLVHLCATEMRRNPELAEAHRAHIAENQRIFCDFLRTRQARGELRHDASVEAAAGLLMGTAYSIFLLWGDTDEETWRQTVSWASGDAVDVVLQGIGAQP